MCGGVGERLGIDPTVVRVIAVLLVLGAGTGLLVYMAAWLIITRQGEDRSIARRIMSEPGEQRLAMVVGTLVIAVIVGVDASGLPGASNLAWPVAISAAGLVFVWRGSSLEERSELRHVLGQVPLAAELTSGSRRSAFIRIGFGLVLVALGVSGLGGLVTTSSPWVATRGFLGVLAVLVGFAIVFGPTWLRTVRSLTEERRERVRSQERADMAAHVHDSVLQTLALIQKAAGDPREVSRLGPCPTRAPVLALRRPAAGIVRRRRHHRGSGHRHHRARGGGRPRRRRRCSDRRRLFAHRRPPITAGGRTRGQRSNAAKWSGAATISLFVEVEPDSVSLFVHDRGRGFDPIPSPTTVGESPTRSGNG